MKPKNSKHSPAIREGDGCTEDANAPAPTNSDSNVSPLRNGSDDVWRRIELWSAVIQQDAFPVSPTPDATRAWTTRLVAAVHGLQEISGLVEDIMKRPPPDVGAGIEAGKLIFASIVRGDSEAMVAEQIGKALKDLGPCPPLGAMKHPHDTALGVLGYFKQIARFFTGLAWDPPVSVEGRAAALRNAGYGDWERARAFLSTQMLCQPADDVNPCDSLQSAFDAARMFVASMKYVHMWVLRAWNNPMAAEISSPESRIGVCACAAATAASQLRAAMSSCGDALAIVSPGGPYHFHTWHHKMLGDTEALLRLLGQADPRDALLGIAAHFKDYFYDVDIIAHLDRERIMARARQERISVEMPKVKRRTENEALSALNQQLLEARIRERPFSSDRELAAAAGVPATTLSDLGRRMKSQGEAAEPKMRLFARLWDENYRELASQVAARKQDKRQAASPGKLRNAADEDR